MTISVDDIVSVRITGDPAVALPSNQGQQIQPSILQSQPPLFGHVEAVTTPGPPVVVQILWDNTVRATVQAAAEDDTCLDRITAGDAAEVQRLLGTNRASPRWVRHIMPGGDTTSDASGGTSRSYDGRVVAVYKRTPIEDVPAQGEPPGPTFCLIKTEDGLYIEDVSTQFVVVQDR